MQIDLNIAGETYSIERITLGDMVLLKKYFGVNNMSQLQDTDGDPQVLAGLVYLGMRAKNPAWPHDRLMNEVNDVSLEDFGGVDTAEDGGDPKAGEGASTAPC